MAVTRTLIATYGAYTVAQIDADRPVRYYEGHESGWCEFDFVLTAASSSALQTLVRAAIDAFRAPRQDFTLAIGGSNLVDWSQSSDTGFDANASCWKAGDPWDTGKSQKLTARIEVGLPADKASLDGRRESSVSIGYIASRRRTLTISGTYTAISGTSASAKYAASIAAWATTIQTAVDAAASWKLVDEDNDYFETDKEFRFSRTYEELIAPAQADTDVRAQQTNITIQRMAPGDSFPPSAPVPLRMAIINVSYTAHVDYTQTQSLTTIMNAARFHVWARILALQASSGLALISSDEGYDEDNNVVTLKQVWHAALTRGWREYSRHESLSYDPALVLVPVWADDPWEHLEYRGRQTAFLEIRETGTYVGVFADINPALQAITPEAKPPPGAAWKYVAKPTRSIRRVRKGLDSFTLDEYEMERVHRFRAGGKNQPPAPGPVITPG